MSRLNARTPGRRFALLLGLAIALAATACGGGGTKETATPTTVAAATATQAAPAAEIPEVDVTATEYRFDAPDTIPGGLTRIRFKNAGTEAHQEQLGRLNDGVTLEQVRAALAPPGASDAEIADFLTLVTLAGGGARSIPPAAAVEVVLDLQPGQYVLVSFNDAPDGKQQWEHGEFHPLEVTAAPAARPPKPETQATVRLSDFAFDAPATLPAGRTTVEVVNAGTQWHFMQVDRVNEDGITADQVSQSLSGTALPQGPSYTGAGGMGILSPGLSGWAVLDLRPGVYRLICFISDLNTGKNHFQLGMYRVFTVR